MIGRSLADAASNPTKSAMGAEPANSMLRFGELGSGTYGVSDVDGLSFASFAPQNASPAAGGVVPVAPFLGGRNDRNGMDVKSDTYNGSRHVVTIAKGQGPLAAMAAMGFTDQQQRAMCGQLARSDQGLN